MLDVEVGEDDGDVGYLLVPSAWTEELHGELSTAARPAELREPEGKIGERERGGGAREERRGRARVCGAEEGLVVPGGRWRRAPRGGGAPCRVSAFGGGAVTRTMVGSGGQREKREERARAGWAAARCALRGGRRLGRPVGWPGCLPRWFSFFFFFENLFFSFSGFCKIRKRKVFGGKFLWN